MRRAQLQTPLAAPEPACVCGRPLDVALDLQRCAACRERRELAGRMGQALLFPRAAEAPDPLAAFQGIQSRYLAYCKAHRAASPDEMLARDRDRWPGGLMTGYVLWIGERWREWERHVGHHAPGAHTVADHAAFDAWLQAQGAR